MDKLLFGTAGIPITAKERNTIEGIKQVNRLGLGVMELEFVRSINITPEKAIEVKKTAQENNIVLTCHAPYFINLNAMEKTIVRASIKRIVNSAGILQLCSGWSLCFHPGYYLKLEKEKVYDTVKKNLKEVFAILKNENINVWIRPETTGRATAFGDIHELIRLSAEFENMLPCIDFAHLHARSIGKFNTAEEFHTIFAEIEKKLGKKALENMHIHMAGINYGDKGELNHLNLKDSDLNYKALGKTWKDFKIKGAVISESPNIEKDALLIKEEYEKCR